MTDQSKATVLVVDDYSMNLKLTEFALGSKYNVITAESGSEALEILSSNNVDLILLDILMPEMDGFETYEKIRSLEGCEDTPVCLLTGADDEDNISRAVSLGLPLISKPFNPAELPTVVDSILS